VERTDKLDGVIEDPIFLEKEDDARYSVFAPVLPCCVSWGASRSEAIEHIREAIELWIESARADGDPIPTPGSAFEYVRIAG
jgi:predicted RNase H-like HicB family nuclease